MARRLIKSLGKPGSVSRHKIRAAVLVVAKQRAVKGKPPKQRVVRSADTASGRKLIAFRKPNIGYRAA